VAVEQVELDQVAVEQVADFLLVLLVLQIQVAVAAVQVMNLILVLQAAMAVQELSLLATQALYKNALVEL
jgi:hypothetical protein